MSHRFRVPPVDTDRRPFAHAMAPGAERGGRMFRAPPPGARPSWGVRPPSHRPPPHRPPPHGPPLHRPPPEHDWPPHHPPPESDWAPHSHEPSDWSAGPPATSHLSAAAEGALGVLSSCGLDAEDLSALAELPEDLLTLKSLPLLLKQIKGLKKGPAPPKYLPPGRTPMPHYDQSEALYAGPASRQDMDQSRSLYRDPGTSKADFPPAAPGGSSFVVEYGHCAAAQDKHSSPERPRRSSPGFTPRGSKEFRRSVESTPILGAVTFSSIPSEIEARDFHGMRPPAFPYSCSLCDITVLSDFVWTQHVTSTLHADSQLALMQRFPSWDCRLSSVCKSDSKQPKETAKKPAKKTKKEATTSSKKSAKVVCVKFPPQSVDESYLRKLIADFGEIVHVAMFPSLGFVELETPEQAHCIIDHYTKTPHKVKDQEMEFTLSTTFNFLQSSFVLNFHPVPFGRDGQSDLLTIIKRFGMPRYTMFIPKRMQAYVEMQNAADAHKMVEYYSDSPLKINGVDIKVSFSQEFRTLERCVMARPYDDGELKKSEEEPDSSKTKEDRSRASTSPAKERRHSRGKSQGKSPARSVRSVSSERQRRERSSASRDRSKSESKSESKPKPEPEPESESKPEPEPEPESESKPVPEAEAKQTEDAHDQSGEDSDIEGMQVVGEHMDDESTDCPPDLRYCITLDEVTDSEEAEAEADAEEEDEDSPRVVYIGNLPLCKFSDPQFIKMVKQVYRPVRYLINRRQRMGLVEFNSRLEARGFVAKMQNYNFGGSCIDVFISNKYNRLPWGRGVEYDEFGQIMRHFRVGNSPQREANNFFHAQLEGTWASHMCPQIEFSRSPHRSRQGSRGRSKDRSRGRSKGRSKDRSRGKSRGRSRDRSKGRSKGRYRDRSKGRSKGRSRDRSRGRSKGRSRDRSRDRFRDKSRERSRSKSADKSAENDKMDTSEKSKSPPPPEKPSPAEGDSQTVKTEPVTTDEEGWMVHKDMGDEEDEESVTVKIENVVSFKDLGEQKQEPEDVAESKNNIKIEQELEEEEEETGSGGGRAAKRKGDGEEGAEPGHEKRLKQEPTTEGDATETRGPSKPVGTEFLLFYCDLCHVKICDEEEARVSHCSSQEHYLKYKEVTGKDPWSC